MGMPFVTTWISPGLRHIANRILGADITYKGPYADWMQAVQDSVGYDQADILSRVADATAQVLQGDADFEQDGKPMYGTPPPSHTLAALLMGAVQDHGRLSVLDFGGGLGSHYLRWRKWLSTISGIKWCVVEQPHFVVKGRQIFSDLPAVVFEETIEQAKRYNPNVVIASGVLQFLREPFATLDELIALGTRVIVLDRTPFIPGDNAQPMTQHVPKQLGATSYPLWLIPRASVYTRLRKHYIPLCEFLTQDAPVQAGRVNANYAGCVWLRKD
ncbi:MAG: methyltransferase, TIGR04325 family [Rhodanobacter sp.]